ncbi:hypothetical protein GPALN_012634 [Globodera pallida]|nr:hypothetical protein GPALN_012634 [Globodera pallida]
MCSWWFCSVSNLWPQKTARHGKVPRKNANKKWKLATTASAALFVIFMQKVAALSSETLIQSTTSKMTTISPPNTIKWSPDERLLLRQAFLRKFGLGTLSTAIDRSGTERQKVPLYIWKLYEKHSANPETETIRHYASSAHVQEDGIVWVTFNLSATGRDPEKEQIVRAELHLPRGQEANGTVHKVTELGETPVGRGIERDGKASLDVALLLRGHQTERFTLAWSLPRGMGPLGPEHLENIALIVFTNSDKYERPAGTSQNKVKRRAKRWLSQRTNSASKSNDASGNSSRQRKHRTHRKVGGEGGSQHQCRRTELYVDFGELNWHDWIMAPSGYEAYQCRGRCTHPLPAKLNTTNHAIVQSLIHSIDPMTVPAPSCVPVQMSAISILYKDVNNVIVVKTYADMRVDACGCH